MSGGKRIALFAAGLAVIAAGSAVFRDRSPSWLAASAAIMICAVFFARYERRDIPSGDIAAAAVMTALAVTGRLIFAAIPAFKPSAAVIILAGIYLGAGQGFLIGSLTALLSNFYFSQGIWTPFQMIVWGLTGLLAGLLGERLKKSRAGMCVFGAAAGLFYSVFLDLCSILWMGDGFSAERFIGLTAASAWFTVSYMVSNCIFLLMFVKPSARIFGRLKNKYGIGK